MYSCTLETDLLQISERHSGSRQGDNKNKASLLHNRMSKLSEHKSHFVSFHGSYLIASTVTTFPGSEEATPATSRLSSPPRPPSRSVSSSPTPSSPTIILPHAVLSGSARAWRYSPSCPSPPSTASPSIILPHAVLSGSARASYCPKGRLES